MNKSTFEEPFGSLAEGGQILKGKKAPSRSFRIENPNVSAIRRHLGLDPAEICPAPGYQCSYPAQLGTREKKTGRGCVGSPLCRSEAPKSRARYCVDLIRRSSEVLADNNRGNLLIWGLPFLFLSTPSAATLQISSSGTQICLHSQERFETGKSVTRPLLQLR